MVDGLTPDPKPLSREQLSVFLKNPLAVRTFERMMARVGVEMPAEMLAFLRKDTLTARGDMFVRDATDVTRLPLGSNLRLLRSNGLDAIWESISPTITLGTDLSGSLTLTDLSGGDLNSTIVANAVSNEKLADMAEGTIKGRAEGTGTGDPTDLTPSQVVAIIDGEAITGLRFLPTSSSAGTNSLYLSAANTPAISSNSTLAMSWDSSQNALGKAAILSDSATAGVGYATGAGGTVTQITSRTTGVTINKVSGAITLVSAAGTATWQSFTVTNSAVAATDVIVVNQKSGTDKNMIHVTAVGAGSFEVTFATTGGTTVEQPVFSFAVIKAVAA
jgi:hypothetical protein